MTTTTSHFWASSMAAFCRCFVGWQTVSMKRTSDLGNRSRINRTSRRTLSIGWVVWATTPKRGRSPSFATSSSPSTTSNSSRSSGHAAHLHVVAFADDDRMKTLRRTSRARRDEPHAPTGTSPPALQPAPARFIHRAFRSAVGRDHDGTRVDVGRLLRHADALPPAIPPPPFRCGPDRPEWSAVPAARFPGQRDGVLHPETHAQMFSANDFHIAPLSNSAVTCRAPAVAHSWNKKIPAASAVPAVHSNHRYRRQTA